MVGGQIRVVRKSGDNRNGGNSIAFAPGRLGIRNAVYVGMRANRQWWAIAVVAVSVTIGPLAAQAWCFAARHACHPTLALDACCCSVGAAEQPSTSSAVVHSTVSVEASPGLLISALQDDTLSRLNAAPSSLPVDRLALFSQLLL